MRIRSDKWVVQGYMTAVGQFTATTLSLESPTSCCRVSVLYLDHMALDPIMWLTNTYKHKTTRKNTCLRHLYVIKEQKKFIAHWLVNVFKRTVFLCGNAVLLPR